MNGDQKVSNARIQKKKLDKQRKVNFFASKFVNYSGDFLCRFTKSRCGLIRQTQSVHKRDVDLNCGARVRVSFFTMKHEHFALGRWTGIGEKFIQLQFMSGTCDKSKLGKSLSFDETFADLVYHNQYHVFLDANGGIKSERHLTEDEY